MEIAVNVSSSTEKRTAFPTVYFQTITVTRATEITMKFKKSDLKIQNEAIPKTKGGESLPLASKQVAPRIVPASSAASLRFVACPLPLLAGTPRNAPCQHSDKKEESRQNTSFRLFQFAQNFWISLLRRQFRLQWIKA